MKEFTLTTNEALLMFNSLQSAQNSKMGGGVAYKIARNVKELEKITKPYGETFSKLRETSTDIQTDVQELLKIENTVQLFELPLKELESIELSPSFFLFSSSIITE